MLLLLACSPPPEAPAAFDELVVWLYSQHADDEAMVSGVTQLQTWLDEHGDTLDESYLVGTLTEATVDGLDGTDRTNEGMQAIALVTQSDHPVDDQAYAMIGADLMEVYPDMFVAYDRTWEGDPDCFLDHGCPRLEAQEDYESHFALGVEVFGSPYNQYLWTDTDAGPAMVQRNWMVEPPDVNVDFAQITEQMYLNAFLPRAGGAWRLQATWAIYATDSLEDMVATLVTGSMEDNHEALETWLDAQ